MARHARAPGDSGTKESCRFAGPQRPARRERPLLRTPGAGLPGRPSLHSLAAGVADLRQPALGSPLFAIPAAPGIQPTFSQPITHVLRDLIFVLCPLY